MIPSISPRRAIRASPSTSQVSPSASSASPALFPSRLRCGRSV
jgi:hypothetical protein